MRLRSLTRALARPATSTVCCPRWPEVPRGIRTHANVWTTKISMVSLFVSDQQGNDPTCPSRLPRSNVVPNYGADKFAPACYHYTTRARRHEPGIEPGLLANRSTVLDSNQRCLFCREVACRLPNSANTLCRDVGPTRTVSRPHKLGALGEIRTPNQGLAPMSGFKPDAYAFPPHAQNLVRREGFEPSHH